MAFIISEFIRQYNILQNLIFQVMFKKVLRKIVLWLLILLGEVNVVDSEFMSKLKQVFVVYL